MRIAIGQLWQETNTLNPVATTRAEFEQFGLYRGAELIERMASTNELGGFIQTLRTWPETPEIVGLVRLAAWPSGPATRETFAWLRESLLESVRAALPVDALLLALHGAMAADGHPDVEGELLAELRKLVGPSLPIVATLDLHANVTSQMVRHATVLVPYHTMPHVDIYETGVRGARVLRRILVDGARPVTAFQKIPAVVPAEWSSTETAGRLPAELKARLIGLESRASVLAAGMLPVQPWLDIPEFGSTTLVTTDGDSELAISECASLAQEFFDRRREYLPQLTEIGDAVRSAVEQHGTGLIVLSDPADATTSGAPGDSVWILEELLRHSWQRPALVAMVSPEAVEEAAARGVGSAIDLRLGGVRDRRFGKSIRFTGRVERLFDARFVMSGHIGKDLSIDMGPSAVLSSGSVSVIVTRFSGPHFAPELFRSAGFDPFEAAVVVAKSPCGFRAVYESRAAAIFSVRAPGCAPTDFWNHDYSQIDRPLWPWDEIDDWHAQPTVVPNDPPRG